MMVSVQMAGCCIVAGSCYGIDSRDSYRLCRG